VNISERQSRGINAFDGNAQPIWEIDRRYRFELVRWKVLRIPLMLIRRCFNAVAIVSESGGVDTNF